MNAALVGAYVQALALDWHQVRVASRVQRHVEHLREVARHLSTAPDRLDRLQDAAAAETQFWDFLSGLQRTTPRAGLNAKTASFIDHLDKLKDQEKLARQRRSFVRRLGSYLKEILSRWMALI